VASIRFLNWDYLIYAGTHQFDETVEKKIPYRGETQKKWRMKRRDGFIVHLLRRNVGGAIGYREFRVTRGDATAHADARDRRLPDDGIRHQV